MLTLVRLRLNMLEVTPKLKRVWHPCPTWYWKNCVRSPATVPGNAKTPFMSAISQPQFARNQKTHTDRIEW